MTRTLFVATLIFSAAWLSGAQNTPDGLFGAALHQEEVRGDCRGAITLYQRVLTMPGLARATAAQALLHIAQCYEQLGGDTKSLDFYERVVNEFADQRESAAIAQAKLEKVRLLRFVASGVALGNRQVSIRADEDPQAAISWDGRYLSYIDRASGNLHLMLRDLSTGTTRVLVKAREGQFLSRSLFSRDGKQLVYLVRDSKAVELRVIGVNGIGDRVVYQKTRTSWVLPVGWHASGNSVLATVGSVDNGLAMTWISLADGKERWVKAAHTVSPASGIAVSPDSRYIAYEVDTPDAARKSIHILSTDGNLEFPLVDSRWQDRVLAWLPDSKGLLFSSDRTSAVAIWSAHIKEGVPEGTPILVKDSLGQSFGWRAPFRLNAIGITSKGSLFYTISSSANEMYVADIDPQTGKVRGKPSAAGPSNGALNVLPAWSPDSRSLAYHSILAPLTSELSHRLLHLYYPDSHSQRDLTPEIEYLGHKVAWFPDSRSLLLWGRSANGKHYLYRVDASSGKSTVVVPLEAGPGFMAFSKDARTVYYVGFPVANGPGSPDLTRLDLITGEQKVLYTVREGTLGPIELSPDGLQLAFRVTNGTSTFLYVMPASGGGPREVFRTPTINVGRTGYGLAWTSDGRSLYFSWRKDQSTPWSLWRIGTEGGTAEDVGVNMPVDTISVRPDGGAIAFNAPPKPYFEIWTLENIRPRD